MTASTNTLALVIALTRAATNRGQHDFTINKELTGLVDFSVIEKKILASAVAQEIPLGAITTAKAVIIFAPTQIGLHINGAGNPEHKGTFFVLFDTDVTSLHVDNDLINPAADVTVEVWIAS